MKKMQEQQQKKYLMVKIKNIDAKAFKIYCTNTTNEIDVEME